MILEDARSESDSYISPFEHAVERWEMGDETEGVSKGLMEGVIEALTDKHSQLDLRLKGLTLSLGDSRLAVRLSGDVTVAVHLRDLTEEEKAAHAASNVAALRA